MAFKDHFSKNPATYKLARPSYPAELFEFLAKMSPERKLCWDVGAGNGQASVSLARFFERVIATEPSGNQLQHAIKAENVDYRIESAEASSLPDNSTDLITVAQAAHWFDLDMFYREVIRVSKPNGMLALWTYSEACISPSIDKIMEHFMYDYLKEYWPDERWYVRNKYSNLPFPFAQLTTPMFECRLSMTRHHFFQYVSSWSAYNRYIGKNGISPLPKLETELESYWPAEETKEVVWPLHIKCARVKPV